MKWQVVLLGTGLLQSVTGFVTGFVTGLDSLESPGPECLSKCWENSKYVSSCVEAGTRECLCEDAQFQNIVLQCLYSQCPMTQFGSALHHALSQCSDLGIDASGLLPPLIRHQGLRKRQNQPMASVSANSLGNYVSASAVHSVARRSVAVSASASTRPTRSVVRIPAQATKTPIALVSGAATSTEPSNGANITIASVLAPTKTS